MRYFKIRSWHIRREPVTTPWKAYCGQRVRHTSEVSNELPGDEKSCETCLRISHRLND